MSPTAPAYPPPLSEAPTVGTLRDLLVALQRGTYEVPPVPPLPVAAAGALTPVRAAMESVATSRWHVEHVGSGVPVSLAIGDRLDTRQLVQLRDELGVFRHTARPLQPAGVRPPAPASEPASEPGPRPPSGPTDEDLDRRDLRLLYALAAALGSVGALVLATSL